MLRNKLFITVCSSLLTVSLLPTSLMAQTGAKVKSKSAQTQTKKTPASNKTIPTVSEGFQASSFVEDLIASAKSGKFVHSEDFAREVEKISRTLHANTKQSPLLLSDERIDFDTVLQNLALRLADENTAKQVWRFDLNALVQSGKSATEIETEVQKILAEVEKSKGKIVLAINDVAFQTGNVAKESKTAQMIRQAVIEGKAQLLGASTFADFNANIADDEKFNARFRKIAFDPNNDEDEYGFVGDKISPELREVIAEKSPNEKVRVILQSGDLQNPELRAFLESNNIRIRREMSNLEAMSIELPVSWLEGLAAVRQARHLSLDRQVQSLGHIEDTLGVTAVRAQSGNSSLFGTGVGIVIMDSGIDKLHNVFLGAFGRNRVVFERNFTTDATANDSYGHGTHVAALAGGTIGFGTRFDYRSPAPNADLINLKVLNSQGTGTVARVLEAIDWIIANKDTYKIRVVNMSFGMAAIDSYRNDPLCRAVKRLSDMGIVVIAAAGNDGKNAAGQKLYGTIHSPGNEPSAITVGASNTLGTNTRSDDIMTTYSSSGPTRSFRYDSQGRKRYDNVIKPDLVAPGNKIIAAEAKNSTLISQNPTLHAYDDSTAVIFGQTLTGYDRMMYLNGTSMAAPLVAGSVAMMLQANPKLTPNMVKMILQYTAQPLRNTNHLQQGAGQLNVEGAVRLAKLVRQDLPAAPALNTPMLTTTTLPTQVSVIEGQNITWAGGIFFNKGFAKSTKLITNYQVTYGQGLVMNDGFVMNDGLVMNDGIYMSDGLYMSDNLLTSDGRTIADGTFLTDFSQQFKELNGIADRAVFGNGLIMSDGLLMSDGLMMNDSTQATASSSQNSYVLVNGDNTPFMH